MLSAAGLNAAHAQELDAHALAASGDATAEEALGRVTGAFAWQGGLVLRAERSQTVRLAKRRIGDAVVSSYRLGRTILLGVRFTEPG